MAHEGYIDYFAVLELDAKANPGDVKRSYRKHMKALVNEIAQQQITPAMRDAYLLRMAQLNAAFYVLRDDERRQRYEEARATLIDLEDRWVAATDDDEAEKLRRQYQGALKNFLANYMEEAMLEAGRDKDCVEASHWDPGHERHAGRILRHHRQRMYQKIHERLPYSEITEPKIDWDERARVVADTLAAGD